MMGRVQIWWRFWCLFSVQCSPHSGQGLVLVLEPEVLSKPGALGISFPFCWHLLYNFSPAPFTGLLLFPLCSLWLCPSLPDSFCTPGMTLSSLPLSLLLLFLSNTSFLCDLLDCQCCWFQYLIKLHFQLHFPVAHLFFYCLHLPWSFFFKVLSFHPPFTAVLHHLLLLESVMLLLPLNLPSLVSVFCN